MALEYYAPEHDLNGTARELCKDAYNGYVTDTAALRKVRDFVKIDLSRDGDKSVTPLDLSKVNALIEAAEEAEVYPDASYSIGRMKFDLLNGMENFSDFRFFEDDERTIDISTLYENNTFVFAITENTAEGGRIGVDCVSREDFLKMSHSDFERRLNECYYYAAPEEQNEIER